MRKLTLILIFTLSFSFANKATANRTLINTEIISLFNAINESLNLIVLTTTNGEFKLDNSYTHLTASDFALVWNPAFSYSMTLGKITLAGSVVGCALIVLSGGTLYSLPFCLVGSAFLTVGLSSVAGLVGTFVGGIDAFTNGGDLILDIHSNHVDPNHLIETPLELHYRLLYNDYTGQSNIYDTGSCSLVLSFDELKANKVKYEIPKCSDHDGVFLRADYAAIREDSDPKERVVISDYIIITDELKFLINSVDSNGDNIDILK